MDDGCDGGSEVDDGGGVAVTDWSEADDTDTESDGDSSSSYDDPCDSSSDARADTCADTDADDGCDYSGDDTRSEPASGDDDCDSLSAVSAGERGTDTGPSDDGTVSTADGYSGDRGGTAVDDAQFERTDPTAPLVPLDLPVASTLASVAPGPGVAPTSHGSLPGIDAATGSLLDQAAGVGSEAIGFVESTFGPGTYQAAARTARADGTTDAIIAARGIEDPAERFFRTEQENTALQARLDANTTLIHGQSLLDDGVD